MILYHYTAREYLDAILREGLTKGDVPLSNTATYQAEGVNAVWFTTSDNAAGHGLGEARFATEEECRLLGVPIGARFPDKRAVRITVKIPKDKLKHWPSYARKRIEPRLYKTLADIGGGERVAKTWYISTQPIPPEMFAAIEVRGADGIWQAYHAVNAPCSLVPLASPSIRASRSR